MGSQDTARRLSGWFFNLICRITGTDPEILATCPQRDRDHVATIALIQTAVFVWQTLVLALTAHVMLARPGIIRPDLIAVAVLLALIIGLIDSYMIIRSSWYLHGLDELKRAGLHLPGSTAAHIKNASLVTIRSAMASALAGLVGVVISILVFAKDVDRHLETTYQAENNSLIQAISGSYDQQTRDMVHSRGLLEAQLAQDTLLVAQASSASGLTGPDADRLQAATTRVATLEQGRSVAEDDLRKAQAFATDELGGLRHNSRNSGIPGRGPRRLAAEERQRLAKERLQAANQNLASERKALDELRQTEAAQVRQQGELVGPRLASLESSRQQHKLELAAFDEKLIERQASRAATIQSAVERDPAYRPREDGLLARASALLAITDSERSARLLVMALGAFLFIVELAAVAAKSFTFVPSTYATTLAQLECLRAREISHGLAEAFNLLAGERRAQTPSPPGEAENTADSVQGPDALEQSLQDTAPRAEASKGVGPRPRGRPPKQARTLSGEPETSPAVLPPALNGRDDGLFDNPF